MLSAEGLRLLNERLPAGSDLLVLEWLERIQINILITRPRNSKLGDFRPPHKNRPPRISINSDLHPVEFLITLAHELAHAVNWNKHGRSAKPHGIEWKYEFRGLLLQILESGLLETKFEEAIKACYFKRESLASSTCRNLRRLFDIDNPASDNVRLEDIPVGSVFLTKSRKYLIKGEKIRTRYKCREVKSRRIYTVHPMAEIVEFNPPKL